MIDSLDRMLPRLALVAVLAASAGAMDARHAMVANRASSAIQDSTPTPLVPTPVDAAIESAPRSMALDSRLKSMDDSIATLRSQRPVWLLGMVAGTAITTVFMIQAQVAANEDVNRWDGSSGNSGKVVELNMMGLLLGLPIAMVSAYRFNSIGSDISSLEWRRKKLELTAQSTARDLGATLVLRF